MRDGSPTLFQLPDANFIDDKAGKPVAINDAIGRRPIAAFGNSDGDLEMLQWTTISGGAVSARSFTTPMPNANMPTTIDNRISAVSTSRCGPPPSIG